MPFQDPDTGDQRSGSTTPVSTPRLRIPSVTLHRRGADLRRASSLSRIHALYRCRASGSGFLVPRRYERLSPLVPRTVIWGSLLALWTLTLCPTRISAQQVVGRVLEAGTDAPVAGALISLQRKGRDGAVARVLAGRDGHYRLNAPEPGDYRLTVERIGYRPWVSPLFELDPDERRSLPIHVTTHPVVLEGLTVEPNRKCRLDLSEAEAVQDLWEEARKALSITALTQEAGEVLFHLRRWKRRIAGRTGRIEAERTWEETELRTRPFEAALLDTLQQAGFVRVRNDSVDYFAPDAELLVSAAFRQEHCFHLVIGEDEDEGLVGLAFEPVEGLDRPDIEGVLWIDDTGLELRHLEFRFVDAGRFTSGRHATGTVEFQRLSHGRWIVSRWWVRMPLLERQRGHRLDLPSPTGAGLRTSVRRARTRLVALEEEGGEVIAAWHRSGERISLAKRGTLTGQVYGLPDQESPKLVQVRLLGTGYRARVDPTGRFRMEHLPEGRYTLSVDHPLLRRTGGAALTREVHVTPDSTRSVKLAFPDAEKRFASACPGPLPDPPAQGYRSDAALAGRVADGEGSPVTGAVVVASWDRWWYRNPIWDLHLVRQEPNRVSFTTGDDGLYLMCGLPAHWTLRLRIELGPGQVIHRETLDLPGRTVSIVDISVPAEVSEHRQPDGTDGGG